MDDFTFTILRLVTTLIAAVIACYVVPLMKQTLDKLNNDKLAEFIKMAVYAAQQTLGNEKGSVRKQYVLDRVAEWLNDKGVKISADQIDLLIEGAVLTMKTETR